MGSWIMEAEKSFYLSSARWRPKKTGDRIQRAEKWRADGVDSSLDLKAWQPGMPRARGDPCLREQMQSSSAFFFVLFRLLGDWVLPTHSGQRHLAYSVYPFRWTLFQKRPHRYTQKQRLTSYLGIPWSRHVDIGNQPSQIPSSFIRRKVPSVLHLLSCTIQPNFAERPAHC